MSSETTDGPEQETDPNATVRQLTESIEQADDDVTQELAKAFENADIDLKALLDGPQDNQPQPETQPSAGSDDAEADTETAYMKLKRRGLLAGAAGILGGTALSGLGSRRAQALPDNIPTIRLGANEAIRFGDMRVGFSQGEKRLEFESDSGGIAYIPEGSTGDLTTGGGGSSGGVGEIPWTHAETSYSTDVSSSNSGPARVDVLSNPQANQGAQFELRGYQADVRGSMTELTDFTIEVKDASSSNSFTFNGNTNGDVDINETPYVTFAEGDELKAYVTNDTGNNVTVSWNVWLTLA